MISAVAELGYAALTASRLPSSLHRWLYAARVAILNYHAVVRSPASVRDWCFLWERSFAAQANYLKRHFDIVRLADLMGLMRAGHIERPTAVITFDDGFQNVYEVAYPILVETGLPATVFLVSGMVDTNDTIWFCRLYRALTETTRQVLHWGGCRYDLSSVASRAGASAAIQARLKAFAHQSLLLQLDAILRDLGDRPDRPVDKASPYRMLGSAEIAVMAASGLIDFGAHTRSHAILSTLPSEHCRQEIEHSVATVTRLTGRPCTLLAYPNGAYNEAVIGLARACGVTAAVTTNRHSNHAAISPMELGRYDIGRDMTMARFVATVHHLSRARPRWRSRRPHSTVDSGEQHDASRHRSLPLRDTGT